MRISVNEVQRVQKLCKERGWEIHHGSFGKCNLVSKSILPDRKMHYFIKAVLIDGKFIDSLTKEPIK